MAGVTGWVTPAGMQVRWRTLAEVQAADPRAGGHGRCGPGVAAEKRACEQVEIARLTRGARGEGRGATWVCCRVLRWMLWAVEGEMVVACRCATERTTQPI